jgi:hypothetical protein
MPKREPVQKPLAQHPSATVPVLAKASLTSEFAVLLGEVGQTARANEVVRVLMVNPTLAADPQAFGHRPIREPGG